MSEKTQALVLDADVPPPPGGTSFAWSDARLLGFQAMDEVHKEFYRVAQALLMCDATSVLDDMDAFEVHARAHFDQEDEWMRSSNFPPRDCHMEEHAAVLKSTQEVRQKIADGQAGVELAQAFAMYLFEWFPGHADYLDSALAAWMCKRNFGGQPVVLRRNFV